MLICDRSGPTGVPSGGRSFRIAIVASTRYPIGEPYPGGLEAHTAELAIRLSARGHHVCLFGGAGSDPSLHVHEAPAMPPISDTARHDVAMPADFFLAEHTAFLRLMLALAADPSYDIVHNNSLHYLPIAMAEALASPVLTTLHTPPNPWLESAISASVGRTGSFVAVSESAAEQWRPILPELRVIPNGVDLRRWQAGPGGGVPVWTGRLVPEKGVDLAIEAARLAGSGLRIAGPCPDRSWYREKIEPLLGDDIQYLGHLDHTHLSVLVGSASVTVASPRWNEPYGLVVAESMACGTPIAGFARGALTELVDESVGVLVEPDDVEALAGAIDRAAALDRGMVRAAAVRRCSVERMVDDYEVAYGRLVA